MAHTLSLEYSCQIRSSTYNKILYLATFYLFKFLFGENFLIIFILIGYNYRDYFTGD